MLFKTENLYLMAKKYNKFQNLQNRHVPDRVTRLVQK